VEPLPDVTAGQSCPPPSPASPENELLSFVVLVEGEAGRDAEHEGVSFTSDRGAQGIAERQLAVVDLGDGGDRVRRCRCLGAEPLQDPLDVSLACVERFHDRRLEAARVVEERFAEVRPPARLRGEEEEALPFLFPHEARDDGLDVR